VYSEV